MRRESHVRFGGRAEETDRPKGRHRASARPYTEHPTREGKVYRAVVLDVFSRRVVGWSIDTMPTAALVTNALGMCAGMAIEQREPDGTVIHSDSAPSSPRGRSPGAHPARARLRPHALHGLGRGLPVTTMPSSSRSGAGCRSSSSTVGNGGRASSSPTRSSSTSRSSTIASVVTRRLACLPRSSSRLGTSQRQSHESSLATPRNSGQPTVPEAATQSAAGAVGS